MGNQQFAGKMTKGTETNTERCCDYCNSTEGKLRPVGQYVVQLSTAKINGEVFKACQSCRVTNKEFLEALKEKNDNSKTG